MRVRTSVVDMPDDRPDPLADLFTLFATPLSGTVRSIEQFRKGVDEFLRGVENFNRTMENLNETTERINALVSEIEPPLRAAIPQVTRTVKTADEMMQVVSGPAMAVAPGLTRLAETLATPAFAQLPAQIGAFSDVLAEVSKRLGPLTQFAESAGGLFGGLRIPGSRPSAPAPPVATVVLSDVTAPSAEPAPSAAPMQPVAKKAPARKKAASKRAPAKKKSVAKKKAPAKRKAAASTAPAKRKAPAKKKTAPKKQAAAKKKSAATPTPVEKTSGGAGAPAKGAGGD